jgi:hypothetical protein
MYAVSAAKRSGGDGQRNASDEDVQPVRFMGVSLAWLRSRRRRGRFAALSMSAR